ncbi:lF-82 [Klebsiella quasipneumoniae]|nr:lF-82 [Klebsiella quasipneumoniae]
MAKTVIILSFTAGILSTLYLMADGRWMMIQRGKEYGGGYWFGRAYADCFWLEFERPMPLSSCVEYVVLYDHVAARAHEFEDEFKLE